MNIRLLSSALVTLCLSLSVARSETPNTLSDAEKAAGWKLLWDGQSPQGWQSLSKPEFPAQGWVIADGTLTVLGKVGGDLVTTRDYSSFELTLEFLLTPGANSGVKLFIHAPAGSTKLAGTGPEFQLLDDERHPDAHKGRDGNHSLGSLYDLIAAPKTKIARPIGEWNQMRILVEGGHVEHWLNGQKLLEYDRFSPAFKELVAQSKYAKIPDFGQVPAGRILLQDHGDKVSFRNLKIREITAPK